MSSAKDADVPASPNPRRIERGAFGLDDILAPRPPLQYLAEGMSLVAGAGAPHLIAAYGYTGKTLLMQGMFVALASGLPVWGVFPCAPTRVVHIDYEQGENTTFDRYQRFFSGMNPNFELLRENLSGVCMPQQLALTARDVPRWRELMAGKAFILIDSLRAAMPDVDENDSRIRSGLDLLGNLSADTGCRPIVIHHTRKDEGDGSNPERGIRGSGGIFDACDTVFYCTARRRNGPVKVQNVKARTHGMSMPDMKVQVMGGPREPMTVEVLSGVEKPSAKGFEANLSPAARRVLDALKTASAPLSGREIRLVAMLDHAGLERAREELNGRLTESSGPRNSILFSLKLTGG